MVLPICSRANGLNESSLVQACCRRRRDGALFAYRASAARRASSRVLAESMNEERAIPFFDWPQPSAGAPVPEVFADDTSLSITYMTSSGRYAVVHFPLCSVFTFGAPNDEALAGHPLYGKGLKFYSIHRVENSSWISELERRNSGHPSHDRERFLEDKMHYVFTFHDSTLECVVNEGKWWKPEIREFASTQEARAHVEEKKKG
jgi:hypothetical protein